MSISENEHRKNNVPKSPKEWLVFLIPIFAGVLYLAIPAIVDLTIERMREKHEIKMYNMKNTDVQHFYSKTTSFEEFDMNFWEYKIESEPVVKGLHVIMYPYLVCKNEENRIVPVEGLFMQNEYVADANGCCNLLREETDDDLIQSVKAMTNITVDMKCLVAVKYVKNDEEQIEVYDLKDGELMESSEKTVIRVLEACQKKSGKKLNMKIWSEYKESDLKEIFS